MHPQRTRRHPLLAALRAAVVAILLVLGGVAQAAGETTRFEVDSPDGEALEVQVFGSDNTGPLFIWLANQYAEMTRAEAIAHELAGLGARVWQVDLLDSLFLERTAEAIRNLDGTPVAALIDAARETGADQVIVVACDRMAAPALHGLRRWQELNDEIAPLDGAMLFFPNLYRGTPIAGEAGEFLSITRATNLPLMIFQPENGAHRSRLDELLARLSEGGSQVYTRIVPSVRDYYLLDSEDSRSEAFDGHDNVVPPDIAAAVSETPQRMLDAARVLAFSPRPATPVDFAGELDEIPAAPVYGLVERPSIAAPDFDLIDARGERHRLEDSLGRITLVNFWATWCPPCVHEIPSMNRLAAAYEADTFAIVSINFREQPGHILDFMQRVEVDFPVLMDEDGAVSGEWGVFAFPSSFILDRDGRIRYSVNTAIEWDTDDVFEVIDALAAEDR